ncbi:MAG: ABC transporter substrate-binding protein [Candidatus Competibacteraceae bacterium]|nr:ABC transporter substrate-binding protein [Candidatus Competibacteraceae bacterium]
MMTIRTLFCFFLILTATGAWADSSPVLIGIDAEFGVVGSTSAQAIRLGAQIAVDEINAGGGVLGGRLLALVEKDDHSVPARFIKNLHELAADPNVVAVLCGRYSPVVVEAIPDIHQLKLPLLDPWAAADPITAHDFRPNYIFRLSLRDTWAVQVMIRHAEQRGIRKIGILVPNTEWGRSNLKAAETLRQTDSQFTLVDVQWFNWGDNSLLDQYQALRKAGAEGVLFVSNEREGVIFIKEVAALPKEQRLPIFAAWGITGGNLFQNAGPALKEVDLAVVQTYSFIGAHDPVAQRVVQAARHYGVDSPRRILSPVGVAHAYDLVQILARAIQIAGSTDRSAIRDALEKVTDYAGLVKTYPQPFTSDRHEALSPQEVFMARYAEDGAIIRIDSK